MSKIIRKLTRFIFPRRKYIFWESRPNLADNTKPVFDEVMKRDFFNGYKHIWWVDDCKDKHLPKMNNVIYVDRNSCIHKIVFEYYCIISELFVYCNKDLPKYFDDQTLIFLGHISPLKNTRVYYVRSFKIDYCIAQSEYFKKLYEYEASGSKTQIVALGYPRTDVFFHESKDIRSFLGNYDKIIVWYPTFRQNKYGVNISASSDALPIIHDLDKAKVLNKKLKEQNILIVIKPHFSQDLSYFRDIGLSNILFITDDFYWEHHITSYEFVSACDALITDYSSIYYDYTLKNKPVAVIWEDIEAYKKCPGFAIDIDYYFQGAEKIYNVDDFCKFIDNVSVGKDVLSVKRNFICGLVNDNPDGKSAVRVVDLIEKRLGEH